MERNRTERNGTTIRDVPYFWIFKTERTETIKMEWNGTERNETTIRNAPFSVVSKPEGNGTKRNGI